MTDRIKSLKVILEEGLTLDDYKTLVDAISALPHVVEVENSDPDEVYGAISEKIINAAKEEIMCMKDDKKKAEQREAEHKIEQARFLKEILGEMEYKVIGFFSNSEYEYKVVCFRYADKAPDYTDTNNHIETRRIIAVLQDKKHSCEIEPPVLISHLVIVRLGSEPKCDFLKRVVNTATNILERLYILNHNLITT